MRPYKKSDDDASFGEDPIKELECDPSGEGIVGAEFKSAAGAKAMILMVNGLLCAFGGDSVPWIDGGNWILMAGSEDENNSEDQMAASRAAIEEAGKALGIKPTVNKCDDADENDSASKSDEGPTTEDSDSTTTTVAGPGSRSKPLDVGESGRVDDYDVTVTSIVPDATAKILAADEYNDPPENGQYATVELEVIYRGDDEATPAMDLSVVLSGSDKVQYEESHCDNSADSDYSTIESGGKLTLNVCFDAPAEAIDGGLVFVKESFGMDDSDRVYWTIP